MSIVKPSKVNILTGLGPYYSFFFVFSLHLLSSYLNEHAYHHWNSFMFNCYQKLLMNKNKILIETLFFLNSMASHSKQIRDHFIHTEKLLAPVPFQTQPCQFLFKFCFFKVMWNRFPDLLCLWRCKMQNMSEANSFPRDFSIDLHISHKIIPPQFQTHGAQ